MSQRPQAVPGGVAAPAAPEIQWFYYGGALLLGLALLFLYEELQVDLAWMVSAVTLCFGVLSIRRSPRAAPMIGPLGLGLCAGVATTAWYVEQGDPAHAVPLMVAVNLAAIFAIAGVFLGRGQGVPADQGLRLHRAGQWYAMTISVMAASWTLYLEFLTFGRAGADELSGPRRAALTLSWLIAGILMVWAGLRRDQRYLKHAGLTFTAVAFAKALLYDTTKMESFWRVGVLAVGGAVLMGMGYALQRAKARSEA